MQHDGGDDDDDDDDDDNDSTGDSDEGEEVREFNVRVSRTSKRREKTDDGNYYNFNEKSSTSTLVHAQMVKQMTGTT